MHSHPARGTHVRTRRLPKQHPMVPLQVFHTNPNILHYKNNEPGKMQVGVTDPRAL